MIFGLLFAVAALLAGFLMAERLFPEEPADTKLALGSVMMGSLLTLTVLALHPFRITAWGVRSLVLGALAALAALKCRGPAKGGAAKEPTSLPLLFGALAVVGALTYFPHLSYPYPFHYDEWNHLAYADKIVETGRLFTEPYHGTRLIHRETGFHAFLAGIFLLAGLDPLSHFKYLPALIAVLTGLALFVLLREMDSPRSGILGALLYGTLKSNSAIFGPMVLAPFTLALPFMLMVFLARLRWLKTGKGLYLHLAALLICVMVTIHAALALFTLILIGLMLPFKEISIEVIRKPASRDIRKLAPGVSGKLPGESGAQTVSGWIFGKLALDLALIILFGLLIGFSWFGRGSWAKAATFVRSQLVLPWLIPIGNIFSYISPPLFFFVLCGCFYLWKGKKWSALTMLGLTTLSFILAYKTRWSLVLRPERHFLLTQLFSVMAGAIGLSYLAGLFRARGIALALALGLVGWFQLRGHFKPQFYHYINDRDYETLLWLKGRYKGRRILSAPAIGLAIPFTKNYPLSHESTLRLPRQDFEIMQLFNMWRNCARLQRFAADLKADLVVSRQPFLCPFLRPVYQKTGFVYEIAAPRSLGPSVRPGFWGLPGRADAAHGAGPRPGIGPPRGW